MRSLASPRLALGIATMLCAWGPASPADDALASADSPIHPDEQVVFFPTTAQPATDGEGWEVQIHGWIFEPEEDSLWRGLFMDSASAFPGISSDDLDNPILQRRMRGFLVDNERGQRLSVRIGGKTHALPASEADGHFRGSLRLAADELTAATGEDGWLPLQALTKPGDPRRFAGRVLPIAGEGLSVISDIDDTVKVSHVTDRRALVRATFLEEFVAVDGMPALYQHLAARGAVFHYVSSSPWQLAPHLEAFFARAGLPAGSFHLKDFRVKDTTFLDLFASPETTKPAVIEPLLASFPERRFVLVGDSGEKDPEIYGELAREFPEQVERILIRRAEGGDHSPTRFAAAFRDLPAEVWQVFDDPAEVEGLLPPAPAALPPATR